MASSSSVSDSLSEYGISSSSDTSRGVSDSSEDSQQSLSFLFEGEHLNKIPKNKAFDPFIQYHRYKNIPAPKKLIEIVPYRERKEEWSEDNVPPVLEVHHHHRVRWEDVNRFWGDFGILAPQIESPMFWRKKRWRPTVALFTWLSYSWNDRREDFFPIVSSNSNVLLPIPFEEHTVHYDSGYLVYLEYWSRIFHFLDPKVYEDEHESWAEDVKVLPQISSVRPGSVVDILSPKKTMKIQKVLGVGNNGFALDVNLEENGWIVQRDVAVKIGNNQLKINVDDNLEGFILFLLSQLVHTEITKIFPTFLGDMVFLRKGEPDTIVTAIFQNRMDITLAQFFQDQREIMFKRDKRPGSRHISAYWDEFAYQTLYIIVSMFQGCACAEKYYSFGHGDMHSGNVMLYWTETEKKEIPLVPEEDLVFKSTEEEENFRLDSSSFEFDEIGYQPVALDFGFSTIRISTEGMINQMIGRGIDLVYPWNYPFRPKYQEFEDLPPNIPIFLASRVTSLRDHYLSVLGTRDIPESLKEKFPTKEQFEICFEKDSPQKEERYQKMFPGYPMTIEEELEFMKTWPEEDQLPFYIPYHLEVLLANIKQSSLGFLASLVSSFRESMILSNYLKKILKEFYPLLGGSHFLIRYVIPGFFPFLSFRSMYRSFSFIQETRDFKMFLEENIQNPKLNE